MQIVFQIQLRRLHDGLCIVSPNLFKTLEEAVEVANEFRKLTWQPENSWLPSQIQYTSSEGNPFTIPIWTCRDQTLSIVPYEIK